MIITKLFVHSAVAEQTIDIVAFVFWAERNLTRVNFQDC
jgi:hypothetical protein